MPTPSGDSPTARCARFQRLVSLRRANAASCLSRSWMVASVEKKPGATRKTRASPSMTGQLGRSTSPERTLRIVLSDTSMPRWRIFAATKGTLMGRPVSASRTCSKSQLTLSASVSAMVGHLLPVRAHGCGTLSHIESVGRPTHRSLWRILQELYHAHAIFWSPLIELKVSLNGFDIFRQHRLYLCQRPQLIGESRSGQCPRAL